MDDVLVTVTSLDLINSLKQFLYSQFTIKDLGEAKYFLGIEIARGVEGNVLCQRKYILDIVTNA